MEDDLEVSLDFLPPIAIARLGIVKVTTTRQGAPTMPSKRHVLYLDIIQLLIDDTIES